MYNPFSLSGKYIFITGAASGIGRAAAIECSKMGANLIITDRSQEQLKETLLMLEKGDHSLLICDLTDYDQISAIVEKLPKIDALFSNAGIVKTLVTQFSEQNDVTEIFNINTFPSIYIVQLLLIYNRLNKGASIVFTSSMSGVFCGLIGGSIYGASKAALMGFTKALALELAPRNIRVNTIHPGMINTNLLNNSVMSKDQLEEDAKKYPLKRYGKPEEVAQAVVYLFSDATMWMTGTCLLIDGGYSLQ